VAAIISACRPATAAIAAAIALLPFAAGAEPSKLKLSFFTSDRSVVYKAAIEPFIEAVNAEGKGLIEIEIYFSGALGKGQASQPGLVDKGIADIAFIIPGQTPEKFHDETVIELPGLFRNTGEATRAFNKLIEAKALKGYDDYFVIGAFASADPCCINTRRPVASLAELKGLRIRANNLTEAAALDSLGAVPVLIPANETLDAISTDKIDGAPLPPSVLLEFGLGRIATNHYVLPTSAAPMALIMSRKTFDSLPAEAKALIRKYSGEWEAERWIKTFAATERQAFEQIKSDPRRKVVTPSAQDMDASQRAFQNVVDAWAGKSAHNRDLLEMVRAELAKIRASP
jgi:TRAP-type C4-dicarboxylate transport system substrate-binding protein